MAKPALKAFIDLVSLDAKWLSRWKKLSNNTFINPKKLSKPKHEKKVYSLTMFPYPSGMLHIGHLRVYTISDVLARYYRMKGYDVIHPMGWDAFGLPAENAAVEREVSPDDWTKSNISKMKQQMELMRVDFDWEREVTTCNPDYYKWTQKIFLMLFENGLAYRKKAEINWDPIDNTVLANEQVDAEGRSWRSGAIVEKRLLEQWFLGITKFAGDLNKDLKLLPDWPSKVKAMQKHWIGESHGAEIKFTINSSLELPIKSISTFTTRAETIFSLQYLALAFDHPIVQSISKDDSNLQSFIERLNNSEESENSKEGYLLSDIKVSNPLDPSIQVPVFVAPYVIGGYGHGAVMGCPAHDTRDYEYWLHNMGKNSVIIKTVDPKDPSEFSEYEDRPFTSKRGVMNENAREFKGLDANEARDKVIDALTAKKLGSRQTNYKIRDWLISRQRYWGAPIPIIHCDSCGPVAVPDEQLPVELPKVDKLLGRGGSPLAQIPEFVNTTCPSCHKPAKRDTDTMDTFMDSSWYMFRYLDANNDKEPFGKALADKYMPVDQYIGGIEHAILHLLYTRFVSKFLYSIGKFESELNGEPIKKLVTQGMVHGKTFVNPSNGRFLKPNEYELQNDGSALVISNGQNATISYEKMSKSKYNGADPSEVIGKYGADATRVHILFQAPINDVLNWDEAKIVGVERWLRKVINFGESLSGRIQGVDLSKVKSYDEYNEAEIALHNELEILYRAINDSFEKTLSLNFAIARFQIYTKELGNRINESEIDTVLLYNAYVRLLQMISPMAPATAEEANEVLHSKLGKEVGTILTSDWPEEQKMIEGLIQYNVMVNGKMRFVHKSGPALIKDEKKCLEEVMQSEGGEKWLKGKVVKKVIMKKDALVFIVK